MFAFMSLSSNLPIPLFISQQLHLIYFCLSTMSNELGLTPDEAIFYISQIQLQNFIFTATLTLAVYDTILSFPKEVKCIWQGQFGTGPILYLFIRYGTVFNMLLELLEGFPFSSTVIISVVFSHMQAAFDCVRIWSICQHAWIPTILVFVLRGVITRAISVVADAVVLGLTLWKTIYIFREKAELRAHSKLTTRLAYGGSMEFGILLLLNILAVLLDILAVAGDGNNFPNGSEFIFIKDVLNSIILSHFILSLRSTYHTTNNPSQTSSKQSSLHFASAVEGNMGASLSGSWGSNRDDEEQKDTEGVQYSDYPFAAGLANIKEVSGDENVEEVPEAGPSGTTHEPLPLDAGHSTTGVGGFEGIELQEIDIV
ncbi:hypothetical protein QCA50_008241 [Cerrena zonata]|uniref:DUF6533 domain-containing protein n=1 Tax=Cerrena zonata TaxID=2478898 RepID=A0AAW0G4V5_9APHY